jgi:acyl-CoA reductase-like NAD-dependent aldehyde dehydrogenase
LRQVLHHIGGRDIPSVSGAIFVKHNPATGEPLAEVARGVEEDVDLAVEGAWRAFQKGPWPRMTPAERGRKLAKVAELLRTRAHELAEAETIDSGKPFHDNLHIDLPFSADFWDFYAGAGDKLRGYVAASEPGMHRYTLREPYGVIGCIAPWNFPIVMFTLKTAPALAVGNCVVFKMAEQTPTTTSLLAQLCLEAGIPEGVVNVVHGYGPEAGAALVRHPKVGKIAFTGSTAVGIEISRAAAEHMKPVLLELGGKAATIVFADADLEMAVQGALQAAVANAGQFCLAASRVLVEERIADEFTDRVVEKTRTIRVGDPMAPGTHLGPLVSREQNQRVSNYIAIGKQEGAQLVFGGGRPELPEPFRNGYFVEPAVFTRVRHGMRIAQEEIFGPVVGIIPFRTEEEALALANNTRYGLSSYFWTKDVDRVQRVSRGLDTGLVFINMPQYMVPSMPSAGRKMSGIGETLGMEALEAYTQSKSVYLNYSGKIFPWLP